MSKGNVTLYNPHAAWLLYLMETDQYKDMIDKLQEDQPRCIFHHKNLSEQTRVMLIEQLAMDKDT